MIENALQGQIQDFIWRFTFSYAVDHQVVEGINSGFDHFSSLKVVNVQKVVQANLDMTDSMGPGKLVRYMQNLSYTYDEYLICIGLGPSISSVICKNPSDSGSSYPSSPVFVS